MNRRRSRSSHVSDIGFLTESIVNVTFMYFPLSASFEAWPTLKPKKVRFDPQQVKKFNEKVEELNNDPTLLHKIPLPAKKNNNMSVKKYFRFKPKMSDATRRRILIESWRPKPLPMSPEKEEPPNKVAKKEDANEKEDAKDDKEKKPTTGCSKCCKCNC